MINTLTTLLLFQTLGEALSYAFALPVSGAVIGMLLLFIYLVFKSEAVEMLAPSAQKLLKHLVLLFIPSGVGIMVHMQRVADEWLPIALALVVSTVVSLMVTACVMRGMQK